jgi:serine protease Do
LYITGVEEDSAADEMGIEPGDILVSIDEVNITDGDVLSTALYAYKAGDKVELIVYRAGRYYSLELTLNEATG